MLTSKKLLACLIASSQLVACGGGGGGSGGGSSSGNETRSFSSQSEADQYYAQLASSSYQGETNSADLSQQDLLVFSSFFFGTEADEAEGPTAPVLASISSSQNTLSAVKALSKSNIVSLNSYSEKKLASINSEASISSDVSISAVSSSEFVSINETFECESGSVSYSGKVDEYGVGVVNVTFHACEQEGAITDGRGHISNTGSQNDYTLYYDGVRVSIDGNVTILNGYIDNEYSYPTYTSRNNLTVTDLNTSLQVRYQDFIESYSPYNDSLSLNGTIYLADLGFVTVQTNTPLSNGDSSVDAGDLTFSNGNQQGRVHFYSEDNIVISLDQNNDGEPEIGILLSDTSELSEDNIETLQFIAYDDINMAPVAGNPRIYYEDNWQRDTRFPIYAENPSVSDPENDPITFVEYRWYVNDELVLTTTTNEFPPHTAFHGDEVGVRVLVSDGQNRTLSGMAVLTVGDAPSVLEVSDVPASFSPGDVVSFTAAVVDPDTPDQPTSAVLEGAPEGMTIDDEGQVTWTAVEPEFMGISSYRFQVKKPLDQYDFVNISFQVVSDTRSQPLARSGINVPKTNYSMHIGNFDGVSGNEILSTDSYSKVMLIENTDQGLQQKWMYPYALPTDGRIRQTIGFDIEGDSTLEIIIATEKGVSYLGQDTEIADVLYSYSSGEIKAISMDRFELGRAPSLVILVSDSNGGYLDIVDINTKSLVKRISVDSSATEVVLGNVDSDSALEIITNNGYVYDGSTLTNQWFYASGFGSLVAVGDIDADGIDEIFGANNWGLMSVYDAVTKTSVWQSDNFNTCSLLVENIDDDAQEEIIVGDCQWGDITAYDLSNGTEQLEQQWNMFDHGSKSLVFGDSDNDGDNEIHWGTGQSSTGEDYLVCAELNSAGLKTNDPGELDYFIGAGWAKLSGEEKGVFIIPETNNGYDGLRIALLDPSGTLELSDEMESNWDRASSGVTSDYDKDGTYELFIASSETYDGILSVLNLDDFTKEWTTGVGNYEDNYRVVKSFDFNADGFDDLVYANGNQVRIVDVVNEVILSSDISLSNNVLDYVFADFNNDEQIDIAVASQSTLEIWTQDSGSLSLYTDIAKNCNQLEAAQLDLDSQLELVCLQTGYSSSSLQALNIEEQSISLIDQFSFDNQITEIVKDSENPSQVFYASLVVDDYGHKVSNLSSFDLNTGHIAWQGPDIVGAVMQGSWHIRSEADANGEARMLVGTSEAMYLIQ
ncbi:FG-GAP repeat domain-containing protein [Litoribrevibacter albus]|uniref:FG-GAP repeat protein n=1 Tax=Litoribrevibacter albus TaxID=1473156 RepID=A0AA37SCC9_9GAMM|nr:VCBS repeat-containing protein [Litoribrevibacter albus]GLQ32731.1 hypothetical protein GCM10007876_32100 [Litoribrevibacter albus]